MSSDATAVFLRTDRNFDSPPGVAINRLYLADESAVVREILDQARLPASERELIRQDAMRLVAAACRRRNRQGGIEAFLHSTPGVPGRCRTDVPRRSLRIRMRGRLTGSSPTRLKRPVVECLAMPRCS
jgi:hypothetical protein